MKKIVIVLLLLCFVLTSCQKGHQPDQTSTQTATPTLPPTSSSTSTEPPKPDVPTIAEEMEAIFDITYSDGAPIAPTLKKVEDAPALPEGEGVKVEMGRDDLLPIPDRFNTGCDESLLTPVVPEAINQGMHIAFGSNGELLISLYHKPNHYLKEGGVFYLENLDFGDYSFAGIGGPVNEGATIRLVLKNCKLSSVSVNRDGASPIYYEFLDCTLVMFAGSNASFDRCYFGGNDYRDGLNPMQNVTVKNSLIAEKTAVKYDSEMHTDGVQIYGYRGDIIAKNLIFDNMRVELPAVTFCGSAAIANSLLMISLDFNHAQNIQFLNCIINGGGNSIAVYDHPKKNWNDGFLMDDILFKNIRYGETYIYNYKSVALEKTPAEEVVFDGLTATDALYVGSVWHGEDGTHFSLTNDTLLERTLMVLTDTHTYYYTVPACPSYAEVKQDQSYQHFPFDMDVCLPEEAAYVVCYDITDGNAKQIRFLNFTEQDVYVAERRLSGPFETNDVVIHASGVGANRQLTWTLYRDGTLVVEGIGPTMSFNTTSGAAHPFYAYKDMITRVVFEDGITSVGRAFLYGMTSVKEVVLPPSIESIEDFAFGGCSSLETIHLPYGLKKLGSTTNGYVFARCTSLTSMVIPSTVTELGNRTFENCSSLEYAIICCPMTTLPSSTFANCTALKWVAFQGTVTAIGGTAFYRCSSLEEIRFSGTEEQLRAITYPEGEAENNHKYFYQAKYTPWTTEQILSYEDPSEFGSGKTMPQVTLQDTISKIYDGTPAERLPLIITDVRSPITVTYRQGSKVIPSPPTAPGIYTVVLDFAETDTHFERRVSMLFEIKKDQGDILLSDPSLEKIEKMENGFPVTVPAFEVVGDGVPTILWYWGEQELLSPPTFAGQYRLVISLPETAYFMGKVIELECVISAPYKDNVWQGDIAQTFAGGDGTEDNPYLISTPAELAYMAQMVNGNALYQNLHYRLTNDIYLNSELSSIEIWHKTAPKNSWTAIGTEEHPFLGTFDGQNHVIFGLYICGFDTYSTGLFGCLGAGSVVENLRITNSMVLAPDRTGTALTGILAAHADGATIRGITIDSCRLQAIRNASGGLLGAAEAQHGNIIIEDCHISFQFSQTDAELTRAFGGVIGNILGGNSSYYIALTRVEVEGYISATTTASGMIANAKGNAYLLFEDCENRATIEVAGSATGFCNSLTNTIVEVPVSFIRCQNNGKIISSENNASGFVDKVSAMLSKITFEGCESNGEIKAPCGIASGFICSLTGASQQNASITFANCICYATPEGETSAAIIAKVTEKHPPISFYYCSIPRGTEAIAGEEMLPDGVTYPDYD